MKKLLVLLIALLLCVGGAQAELTAAAQLNAPGVTVGVDQGSAAELTVRELLPNASVAYFTDKFMGYTAVAQGKIDAFVYDRSQMQLAIEGGLEGVHLLDETLGDTVKIGVGLSPVSKIPDLENKLNQFIADLRADGTLDDMYRRWVTDENEAMPKITLPGSPSLHLTVGTSGIVPPYSYYQDGQLNGYDIELAYRFAAWLGADVEFKVYDYGAIIPAALTGDVDCVMANLNITPERQEALTFSDVLYENALGILVRGEASAQSAAAAEPAPAWAAYNGKRLGVITGGLMETVAHTYFPDSEYLYLNGYPDCIAALLAGKIDAYLGDEPGLKSVHAEEPRIDYIRPRITNQEYSFAFRKDDPESAKLCEELNAFLARSHADGTMQELDDIWFGADEDRKVVDMSGLTGENGTLRVVTTSTDMPFSYIKDGKNVGYDIDLVVRFCRAAGYKLELGDVDFAARIPAIQSGKYDFTTDMNVTPERREEVLFSDPTSTGGVVLAILTDVSEAAAAEPAAPSSVFDQFAGKTIGVQTGTTSGLQVQAEIPSADLAYFNSQTDLLAALRASKIDAWGSDEATVKFLQMENPDLRIVEGYLDTFDYAPLFSKSEKGQALCAQYSAFVDSLWADGTMDRLEDIWFGTDESLRAVLDYEALPATNGILRMALDTSIIPFAYMKYNRVVGYDVDIAARFCQVYGYRLEVVPMSFDGVLASVKSGKCDFAACGITVTEERKESVLFGSATYKTGAVLAVMKSEAERAAQAVPQEKKITLDDLDGQRVGVLTGTISGRLVEERLPNAKVNYYNAQTDSLAALRAGKIDAWTTDEPILRFMQIEYPQLELLDEHLAESNLAAIFPKTEAGQALRDQFSEFLDRLWAEGTMAEIDAVWFGADEAKHTVLDYESLPAVNGTLRMAADLIQPPFTYMKDGRAVGYDIDVAARFCQEYGYGLEIESMSFDSILAAIQTGKCDFACSSITITEERAESMLFSTPDYYGSIATAIWNDKNDAGQAASPSEIINLSALDGLRIGVQTGTTFDQIVLGALPDAQISYFNSYPDMAAALEAHKIDAFPGDEPVLLMMTAEDPQLAILTERMDTFETGFALPKTAAGEKLLGELNAWIASMQESGELEKTVQKWTLGQEADKTLPDYAAFPATNGTLTLATEGAYAPFNYYREGAVVGMEIDLAAQFCQAYGYGLQVAAMNFDGILPAVQTGKADFAAAGISITDERKESVNFSDPYYIGGTVMAVLKAETEAAPAAAQPGAFKVLSELANARIGIPSGSSFDAIITANFPDAKLSYYNNQTDLLTALAANKIDSFPSDEPVIRYIMNQRSDITYLPEALEDYQFAYCFAKTEEGEKLRDQFSEFLRALKADGTLDALADKWFGADESAKTLPDPSALSAENGTLRMATDGDYPPFEYVRDGNVVGYDVDVAALFCQKYGYGLDIEIMNLDAILPAVQSGKCSFGGSAITITEERAESVLFSEPNYLGSTVMVVLKAQPDKVSIPAGVYTALSQLAGKKIGVQTGTSFDKSVAALIPDAQIEYYNSKPDMINALQTRKIDAYAVDEPVAKAQMQQNDQLTYVPEYMESFDFAYVFAKNDAGQTLCDQFSEYLDAIRADGTMTEIESKWFSEDESVKTLADYAAFPATNGTLNMATEAMYEPFSYVKGNEIVGYDIDIVARFCQAYGYGLKITDMSFDAVLPAVQSGKCDFGGAGITITEERKESVLFSAPNFSGGTVMAVLKAQAQPAAQTQPTAAESTAPATPAAAAPSGFSVFWEGIKSSFNKTFIRENRWQLFLEGIGNTMLITALAILFGTALGFLLFMLCRNGNPVANGSTRFSMWLVQGTPMVVLLMILYYIIFGRVAISGIAVAVIGFTLTFGAAVLGMLRMGVGMIDRGQYEAAYALGHSNRHTFFKIILPQAIPHVLPAFQGEIVGLIKATAIVGYIAVQDLTKMGDIVRSRTYEAFFPLIAITIIYFVLEGLFSFAVSRIRVRIDPKKRKRENILKGVNLHD